MARNKSVKSVVDRGSARKGEFRLRDYKIVAGSKNTEVVHKESGCRFLLDPCKVYFSQREGTERMRITGMIKNNETVMVFFAGAGPFAIAISKHSRAGKIVGIEINPKAVGYFKKNIELNKLQNVTAVLGDVKEKAPAFYGKCSRVIMPLPETSMEYLEEAILCLKPDGICHLYCFSKEEKLKDVKKEIAKRSKKIGKSVRFIGIQRVLPYGPGIYKYRIDFVIE